MSDDPNYHTQPTTLDPLVEIPDDAPLAQGHDADAAQDTAAALDELKSGLDGEQPELGQARAPGDHAEKEQKSKAKKDDKS